MHPRLPQWLRQYAADHRHPVNQAIHKLMVPLIVFHIMAMLDWVPLGSVAGLEPTLAWPASALAALVWLRLSWRYGLVLLPYLALVLLLSALTPWWITLAVAVVAWVVQLIGHYRYERNSPSFFRNLGQLMIGPLFVVAVLLGDRPWELSEGELSGS